MGYVSPVWLVEYVISHAIKARIILVATIMG